MTKHLTWIAPALLALALTVACAAPGAAQQTGPSATEPASASSSPDTADAPPVSSGTTVAASATLRVDIPVPGMSAKSTRGHVWAEPSIDGDDVAILLAVASLGDHVHFEVPDGGKTDRFVGYFSDGEFCVRADFCPLCGAERIESGWSLLVCRSCGTTFDSATGESEGGSANFPSGTVPCTVDGDRIVMSLADLLEAHARTVAGEETLFEEPEVVEDDDDGDTSWPRCCTR